MKKVTAFIGALACIVALSGCGRSLIPDESMKQIENYFPDGMVKMTISHYLGGEITTRDLAGEDLDAFLEWVSGLRCERLPVEEHDTPGDCEGGEVFDFIPANRDGTGVSYIINGTDSCYLLIDNNWYVVDNPTHPPVGFSTPDDGEFAK